MEQRANVGGLSHETCLYMRMCIYIEGYKFIYDNGKHAACNKNLTLVDYRTRLDYTCVCVYIEGYNFLAALAASRRRPTGDPGAPLRPKSDPQAPQKQPRGSHGNGLAALAAPRQRHRGYSDTPLRPQNDAQAAQERPGSRL